MDSNNAHLNIASSSHSKNNTNYSWQKIALLFNLSLPLEHGVPMRSKTFSKRLYFLQIPYLVNSLTT